MTRHSRIFGLLLVSLYLFQYVSSSKLEDALKRKGAERSVFSIIKFPNDACAGTGNRNGTCYTSRECEAKGGTNSGTCAEGYGVCCTFTGGCGSKFSENCTYFESSGDMAGDCRFEVCKCQANICQLRLDFLMFSIAGPVTEDANTVKILGGQIAAMGVSANSISQCNTDYFRVSSPGNQSPPVVCGNLMDEHMYVDASESCNNLDFLFGNTANNMAINRQFNIKITQYSCDFENLAPKGCTQYFFGEDAGIVRTFNYRGGQHLANQDQKICVRAERGNCRICWYANMNDDFHVSGHMASSANAGYNTPADGCCNYGGDGKGGKGFDCVIVPGAREGTPNHMIAGSQICGKRFGYVNGDTEDKTVCSERVPFHIRFVSDNYELDDMGNMLQEGENPGFELRYVLEDNCT